MATPEQVRVISRSRTQALQVFISYAKEDEIALAVYDAIRTALGIFAKCFHG